MQSILDKVIDYNTSWKGSAIEAKGVNPQIRPRFPRKRKAEYNNRTSPNFKYKLLYSLSLSLIQLFLPNLN